MKFFRFILFVGFIWGGATGCGRKVVPVSSNTESKQIKSDSTASTKKDSTNVFFKESVTEKKLPEASVSLKLTRAQLDSLITSMKGLPSVTRTIYFQDKDTRAQLAVLMDSLGNIQFKATSLEKIYWEKTTQQSQFILQLENEIARLRSEKSEKAKDVYQAVQTFWERITENILPRILIWFILGGVTVIALRTVLKKVPFINKFVP